MNTESMQETKILIEDVLSIGRVNDDNIHQKLKEFYSDTTLLQLMADVEAKYEDIGKIGKTDKQRICPVNEGGSSITCFACVHPDFLRSMSRLSFKTV